MKFRAVADSHTSISDVKTHTIDAMPHYPVDDANPGWIEGWAVVRHSPWDLYSVFTSRIEADVFCSALGSEYEVAYGAHRLATSEFIFEHDNEIVETPRAATRWERGAEFIELEGVLGDRGSALVVNTNVQWLLLPLELREQSLLADRASCMGMYAAAKSWAKNNGFSAEGGV
jgi:hypothetical protein